MMKVKTGMHFVLFKLQKLDHIFQEGVKSQFDTEILLVSIPMLHAVR